MGELPPILHQRVMMGGDLAKLVSKNKDKLEKLMNTLVMRKKVEGRKHTYTNTGFNS